MKILVRNMNTNETDTMSEADARYSECQASFNSNGNITLRNYDREHKNQDEIIILSREETRALFKLFNEIGQMSKKYDLPF